LPGRRSRHEILAGVRLRTLGAAAVAVLALAGLAGCRTNVGTAATVDGHRITESDVNDYLTPQAQPVTQQTNTGGTVQVSPRSFVLAQLINERLGFRIVEEVPGLASLTSAQLDARLDRDLGDQTVTSVAESLGLKGYTEAFYRIVLRVQELSRALQDQAQKGVDIRRILTTLTFPVTVSPRYGTWDKAGLSLRGTIGIPSYLTVQPGADGAVAGRPSG
jgi:hypothetical protein